MKKLLLLTLCLASLGLRAGEIDRLVDKSLKYNDIKPSPVCSDDVFLRRTSLLLTGRIPEVAAVKSFLADKSAGKRSRMIDSLLQSEGFVSYQVMKWGDLLKIKSEFPSNLWPNAVQAYNRWLTEQVRGNVPYDKMVYELLTSTGSNFRVGPVNFYRAFQTRGPKAYNEMISLLFMGSRTADEQCEIFFTNIAFKGSNEWKEDFLYINPDKATVASVVKMTDGKNVPVIRGGDLRIAYAKWLTAPDNPYFARAMANRMWSWMMGRGIVHQPDDMRPDNAPSNPELLSYLEKQFVASGFDTRAVLREILNSDAYQRISLSNDSNRDDEALFSHYPLRRLTAEALIDAICDATGVPDRYQSRVPEPFTFFPPDFRAVEIGDGTITNSQLMLFGRPTRDVAFESDRRDELDSKQILYLINSSTINEKIDKSPRLQELIDSKKDMAGITSELYLMTVGRYPTQKEVALVNSYSKQFKKEPMAVTSKNLMWALINSDEFILNR